MDIFLVECKIRLSTFIQALFPRKKRIYNLIGYYYQSVIMDGIHFSTRDEKVSTLVHFSIIFHVEKYRSTPTNQIDRAMDRGVTLQFFYITQDISQYRRDVSQFTNNTISNSAPSSCVKNKVSISQQPQSLIYRLLSFYRNHGI